MSNAPTKAAGALVIWTDIKPEAEEDFNRWYDHQHLEERVGVPGFLNGRRYKAIGDAPAKYLAWYEVESPDVLGSDAYGARQANPTEWTSRIMPEFLNVTRVPSARIAKSGGGLGCIAASLSFLRRRISGRRISRPHAIGEETNRLSRHCRRTGMAT